MTKHRNLLALDLRFAETAPGSLRTAGVVGLVRDRKPPVALHAVDASWKEEDATATASRGIAETRRLIHAEAVRIAADALDVEPEVDAIVSLLRPPLSRARASYLLRGCILQEDAFRATQSFCLGAVIEPACDRMAALADEETVLDEAADVIGRTSLRARLDFAGQAEEWRAKVEDAYAFVP